MLWVLLRIAITYVYIFYAETCKIIAKLSSNMDLLCFTELVQVLLHSVGRQSLKWSRTFFNNSVGAFYHDVAQMIFHVIL